MARWNTRARVIDLGIIEMDDYFVTYNGVKVVLPDGKRQFIGKVIMHNEVNSVFTETQGEFVQLYLSGPGKNYPSLLYGMKTQNEDVYNSTSPFYEQKVRAFKDFVIALLACFVLIGFVMVPLCIWVHGHLWSWDPPSRKAFEDHDPDTDEAATRPAGAITAWTVAASVGRHFQNRWQEFVPPASRPSTASMSPPSER